MTTPAGGVPKLIRPLTELEKKLTDKYRAQLGAALARQQAANAEVARLRDLLGDMAIVFTGREALVTMTEDALYEVGDTSVSDG